MTTPRKDKTMSIAFKGELMSYSEYIEILTLVWDCKDDEQRELITREDIRLVLEDIRQEEQAYQRASEHNEDGLSDYEADCMTLGHTF